MSTAFTGEWMDGRTDITVSTGEVAWLDGKYGDYTILAMTGATTIESNVHPAQAGIATSNLGTGFAVCVLGRRGNIMVHVPGDLGYDNLQASGQRQVAAMRDNFRRLWDTHCAAHINPPTVVLVRGGYTIGREMRQAVGRICPEILAFPATVQWCEQDPETVQTRHGRVLVTVDYRGLQSGNEMWVEGRKVM